MAPPPPPRIDSHESNDSIRKRVCKACDRCRLKKSKCDGSNPCSRCKLDNAICVFGERKKSHDKVYPKGYVEMLEQQQSQLVAGLQEMYKRLWTAQAWTGPSLPEVNGHPLTHDILAALDLLETKHDGSGEIEVFEEDCRKLQSRLVADGASFVHRRGSFSSESEHSQHEPSRPTMTTTTTVINNAPSISRPPTFRESFTFGSATPSPRASSPVQRQRPAFPVPQQSQVQVSSPLCNDPQLFQAEWAIPDRSTNFPMQPAFPHAEEAFAYEQCDTPMWNQTSFDAGPMGYPQQLPSTYGNRMQNGMMEYQYPDAGDIDFNKFISILT